MSMSEPISYEPISYKHPLYKKEFGGVKQKCSGCEIPWRWPRNIAHSKLVTWPSNIKYTSKATIVAYVEQRPDDEPRNSLKLKERKPEDKPCDSSKLKPTIPWNVFRKARLTSKGKLVTHFSYNRAAKRISFDGQGSESLHNDFIKSTEMAPTSSVERVTSSDSAGSNFNSFTKSEDEFYSLITQASWLITLAKCCFVDVALVFMDHYANLLVMIGIVFGGEMWDHFPISKHLFQVGWTVMIVVSLGLASHSAQRDWIIGSDPAEGDLTAQLAGLDKALLKVCLMLFNFFNVNTYVKDFAMLCHPCKRFLPYAAVKIDGTRCFIIGHGSKSCYEANTQRSNFYNKFVQLILRSSVFAFKLYVAVWTLSGDAGDVPRHDWAFSCISSFPSLLYGWWQIYFLIRHRRKMYRELSAYVKERSKECKGMKGELAAIDHAPRCAPRLKNNAGCGCSEYKRRKCDDALLQLKQAFLFTHIPYEISHAGEEEVCAKCGRNAPFRTGIKNHPGLPKLNDKVALLDPDWHDANYGVLKPLWKTKRKTERKASTYGRVVGVVEKDEGGTCRRCLVQVQKESAGSSPNHEESMGSSPDHADSTKYVADDTGKYWYDAYCIRAVDESESAAPPDESASVGAKDATVSHLMDDPNQSICIDVKAVNYELARLSNRMDKLEARLDLPNSTEEWPTMLE